MSEIYKEVFPKRMKEMRLKRGKTQDNLAAFLGVTRTSIANYEIGKNFPYTETFLKIADYLNTSIDYLLGRIHDPEPWTKRSSIAIESLEDLPLSYNGKALSGEAKKHLVSIATSILEIGKNQ